MYILNTAINFLGMGKAVGWGERNRDLIRVTRNKITTCRVQVNVVEKGVVDTLYTRITWWAPYRHHCNHIVPKFLLFPVCFAPRLQIAYVKQASCIYRRSQSVSEKRLAAYHGLCISICQNCLMYSILWKIQRLTVNWTIPKCTGGWCSHGDMRFIVFVTIREKHWLSLLCVHCYNHPRYKDIMSMWR